MKNTLSIREMKASDVSAVKQIVEDNQVFPPEYLDDMVEGYLSGQSEELWTVAECKQDGVLAVTYASPEYMTDGTWNLLLIAVLKSHHGRGIGSKLIRSLENSLKAKGDVRVLLVETSGTPQYELTRAFYPRCGYKQVAVIPEYYEKGDDKVVFWKSLID